MRVWAAVVSAAVAFSAVLLPASPASADTFVQRAVDRSVAAASDAGIEQSVSVVDRSTGELVAESGGAEQYISESIVKLFTVAYYEHQADGRLDEATAAELRTMIINSDDAIESGLWNTDIVPSAAANYGLPDTRNGPKTGPHDWGWELITADDEAHFLYAMSTDPEVAPLLMPAMADVAATGADGFDQSFGLNALTGDHGSKQGWTDVGSSDQVQVHSVGWTDRYFVAILQTSRTAGYDAMRAAATATAQAVQELGRQQPGRQQLGSAPQPDTAAQSGLGAALATALDGVRSQLLAALGRLVGVNG